MTNPAALASVIDAIAQSTLNYALLLAAIGTLSMAFLELVKGLVSVRRRFHRRQLAQWMPDRACRHELFVLAAGGERYAEVLFNQPTERMLGQIQAAANLSLEFPDRYPRAYAFFTKEDLEMKMTAPDMRSDGDLWADFATRTARLGMASDEVQKRQHESDGRTAQQARVRLGNLIARRLDTFQNRTQYRWARGNQAASIIAGTVLSAYALTRTTTATELRDYAALIGLSLLAGMLAPFAKDVVTAISGLRAKA